MIEATLDASVVLKWFRSEGERKVAAARELRQRYEAGELRVLAPPPLRLELVEPGLAGLARWAGRGLTAYDAGYVAVAEETGASLITDDAVIQRAAPELARPL